MPPTANVIEFHQFGGDDARDRLFMFAAPAKQLAVWAGIPRKGWRIRMLFQRWITEGREKELREFWLKACDPDPGFILGPSAITVAIQGDAVIENGKISLEYVSPIDETRDSKPDQLRLLAAAILPLVGSRFTKEKDPRAIEILEAFSPSPLQPLPDVGHNYVLEFALQLEQMKHDPDWFIANNALGEADLNELISAMESLCRPALVVDGQHRLYGAADPAIKRDIYLPVVAMANCSWVEQIYQFVVINEKAQKVDSELLNDIFASSLTPSEQGGMRTRFSRIKVDIEQRIAGVLAGRDESSPFYQMVALNLPNPPVAEKDAYMSQATIQCLIDGGRGARGWRNDDEFYDQYIRPTFGTKGDWDDWRTGKWKLYWFAFWKTVAEYFRAEAKKVKGSAYEIWDKSNRTNLTSGVGLKIFQRFFIERMVEKMLDVERSLKVVREVLPEEQAVEKIREKIAEKAISEEIDEFCNTLRTEFLENFPVRFFTGTWETSLDDKTGHDKLLFQMREAFDRDDWRASGGGVFVPGGS